MHNEWIHFICYELSSKNAKSANIYRGLSHLFSTYEGPEDKSFKANSLATPHRTLIFLRRMRAQKINSGIKQPGHPHTGLSSFFDVWLSRIKVLRTKKPDPPTILSHRFSTYESAEDQFLEPNSIATHAQEYLIFFNVCGSRRSVLRAKRPDHSHTGLSHRYSTHEGPADHFLEPNSLATFTQDVWGSITSFLITKHPGHPHIWFDYVVKLCAVATTLFAKSQKQRTGAERATMSPNEPPQDLNLVLPRYLSIYGEGEEKHSYNDIRT